MAPRLPGPGRRRLCSLTSRACHIAQPVLHIASAVASRFLSRRFLYTLAAVSLLSAKIVHVSAYLTALSPADVRWGLTFFSQDTACLLLLRFLLDYNIWAPFRWLSVAVTTIASLIVLFVLTLAAISISFFLVAGSELHWRNAALASDASSWKLLLTGLVSFAAVVAAVVIVSWISQDLFYFFASLALDIVKWPFSAFWARFFARRRHSSLHAKYAHLPQLDLEGASELLSKEELEDDNAAGAGAGATSSPSSSSPSSAAAAAAVGGLKDEAPRPSSLLVGMYCLVGLVMLLQVLLYAVRPHETSLVFMSWTLPLLPFVDLARSSPALANLRPLYGTANHLGYRTALAEPVPFPWLPRDKPLDGFRDWYDKDAKHYRASEDPLKISNLGQPVLPKLKAALGRTAIRHVVLVKLESTRKDVFPFKKDGYIWNKLAGSFENKTLPDAVRRRLSTLSKTANFITGDYNDGFLHREHDKKRRGGINANQAITSATYTLKSLTGTLCGLSPLVVDFNAEVSHHIYQPCLPHIVEAFNHNLGPGRKDAKKDSGGGSDHNDINDNDNSDGNGHGHGHDNDNSDGNGHGHGHGHGNGHGNGNGNGNGNGIDREFTSYRWKPSFMQSVTNTFDKQDQLMLKWGFPDNNTVDKEYLQGDSAKFGAVKMADVNYYGMPEIAIEDYIRDAFRSARENKERVFLTHLTSTTHHPFGLPEGEEIVKMSGSGELENLSSYLNAVGYVDRWLQKVLDILDEQGVANETLLVFVGDHGLSVAENDGITPYYNPNIGNFHVPLVLSHPGLPAIDINDAVVSYQILPTILDMLLETGSLSPAQARVAGDLVRNYEGQSLIRPLIHFDARSAQANWQFTVMNPGRATVAVRDGRQPHWRLTVPIIENTEWRFTDLRSDAHEEKPTVSFSFTALLRKIEKSHGLEAAKWAEEAAFVAQWWVEENSRRWRHDPTA